MNGIESSDVGSEFEVMGGSHAGSSCLLPVEVSQSCTKIREKKKKYSAEHCIQPNRAT